MEKNKEIFDKNAEISEEELETVSGGVGVRGVCDKGVTSAEFPKQGVCLGTWWSDSEKSEKYFTCEQISTPGHFMKCRKCGFKKSAD